jgi:hypothetical protein
VNEQRLTALLVCLLTSLPAAGEEAQDSLPAIKLSNAARLNYASSDKWLGDERDYFLTTVETKALADIAPDARLAVQVRAGAIAGPLHRTFVHVPFAYLDLKRPAVDIRIGKQILAWGRTDALNPTDVVTPRDYTVMLPFDEDERSGAWGVRANVYPVGSIVASLFYGVKFKPSTLPFVSRGADQYVFDAGAARKRQLGLRIGTSNEDYDFSVSAYRGASLLAQVDSVDAARYQASITTLRYPLIDMLGFDFARNFGKYGVRIEGSSVRAQNQGSVARSGMQPYRYLVAGADRTFLSDLNVNLQLFGRWSNQGPALAGADPRIETMNNLIFVQTRKNTYGMTARVANQWRNQTLSAELFVQHYFGDRSTYLHPMATYAVSDAIKVSAGAVWYLGKDGTLFGVMKKNNAVFSELRYSF